MRARILSFRPDTGTLGAQVFGFPGKIAAEEISERPVANWGFLVGDEVIAVVQEADEKEGKVILSRRLALEKRAAVVLPKLTVGTVVEDAVVKGVGNFLAYVDLGGVRGIVPVTQLRHHFVADPRRVLRPGERVTAKVISVDTENRRVTLSTKAVLPDPWAQVEDAVVCDEQMLGVVNRVKDNTVFIHLPEAGVDVVGFKYPKLNVQADDEVRVRVRNVDKDKRSIGVLILANLSRPKTAVVQVPKFKGGS